MGARMHPFFFLSQERVHAGAPFLRLNPSAFTSHAIYLRGEDEGPFLTEGKERFALAAKPASSRFSAGILMGSAPHTRLVRTADAPGSLHSQHGFSAMNHKSGGLLL